jgi:hypothetical protein
MGAKPFIQPNAVLSLEKSNLIAPLKQFTPRLAFTRKAVKPLIVREPKRDVPVVVAGVSVVSFAHRFAFPCRF